MIAASLGCTGTVLTGGLRRARVTVRVQVRLYSLFRERAGLKETSLEVPAGATVRDALEGLAATLPPLADLVKPDQRLLLVAVNRAYAKPGDALKDGDELALFPPVSGGTGPQGMVLLSGGFDSPVAAKWALDQGHGLDAVHYSMEPFTDDASVRKAAVLARILGLPRLTVVPLGHQLGELAKRCDSRHYFVLQKRLMVRVAERLARRTGATYLLTGENLGQVSSQTLVNLGAIDAIATLPVVRPLLGLDKEDIIDEAKAIGTYETSCGPEVCDVLGPKHPNTAVRMERIVEEETKVDIAALVEAAVASAFDVDPVVGYESSSSRVAACEPIRPARA